MFNGLFPTPPHVIEKMIEGLKLSDRSVLDPSAGKGDILSHILDKGPYFNRTPKTLYAVEIDPGLRAILVEKGFKVVETDFLQYPGLQYFDFIIMNPPFDQGVAHLLKAFEISNGAVIRCLLNSESINNPYTSERMRLAKIIEQFGWVKELGPVFKHAERPTDVSVSLVHLQDPRQREEFLSDFEPAAMNGTDFSLDDIEDNALALANVFESYEARFRATIEAFKDMLVAASKVKHYLKPLTTDYPSPDKLITEAMKAEHGPLLRYETFLESVTKAGWSYLFARTKLGTVTTEGVRKEIEQLQSSQGQMAFTAANMEELFNILFMNRENVMMQCVLEVFDELTKYHKKNRESLPGWKTNTAYAVKSRFILPSIGSYYSDAIDYSAARTLADIEKALCFIAGKRFQDIMTIESVYGRKPYFGEKVQSEFFETKLYKARTMHFRWLDEDLRVQFNTMVARERWNEIPETVKKGVYS